MLEFLIELSNAIAVKKVALEAMQRRLEILESKFRYHSASSWSAYIKDLPYAQQQEMDVIQAELNEVRSAESLLRAQVELLTAAMIQKQWPEERARLPFPVQAQGRLPVRPEEKTNKRMPEGWETQAVYIISKNPNIKQRELAEHFDCDPGTISRSKLIKDAFRIATGAPPKAVYEDAVA